MSQNSPVDGLKRDKNTSDFTKNLIENDKYYIILHNTDIS